MKQVYRIPSYNKIFDSVITGPTTVNFIVYTAVSSSFVVRYQLYCGWNTTKQEMRVEELLLPVVLQVILQQNKQFLLLAIVLLITGNVMKLVDLRSECKSDSGKFDSSEFLECEIK